MTKVRVGMVGVGQWGPNLLRNVAQNPRAELALLCDSNPARLAEVAAKYPGTPTSPGFDDLLRHDDLDAVILATPAALHPEQVEAALRRGLHVLVEKPIALQAQRARELYDLADAARRILMTGHTFLYNPAVLSIARMIRDGELGDIRFILASRLSLGQLREDVNALWNLAPHDIAIIQHWLGGAPDRVSARGYAYLPGARMEDLALCVLEFPGHVLANVQVSWLNPTKVRQMTIVGSGRMVVYDDVSTEKPVVVYDRGTKAVARTSPDGSFEGWRHMIRPGSEQVVEIPRDEPLAAEINAFLDAILTATPPDRGGRDAIDVVRTLQACDHSIKRDGAPVAPGKEIPA